MARKSGVKVFAIGAGDDVSDEELKVLTHGQKGKSMYRVKDFDHLEELLPGMAEEACTGKMTTRD